MVIFYSYVRLPEANIPESFRASKKGPWFHPVGRTAWAAGCSAHIVRQSGKSNWAWQEKKTKKNWLVVSNIFYVPFSWECHHPNWLSYFSMVYDTNTGWCFGTMEFYDFPDYWECHPNWRFVILFRGVLITTNQRRVKGIAPPGGWAVPSFSVTLPFYPNPNKRL